MLFADGVRQPLHVESIPTVLVLDKAGKAAYRTQGFAPDGFADLASAAIAKASAAPASIARILRGAGFSLRVLGLASTKIRRLKPAPQKANPD